MPKNNIMRENACNIGKDLMCPLSIEKVGKTLHFCTILDFTIHSYHIFNFEGFKVKF